MSSKYVSETAAAKSVSAYVILNKKGIHVATVRAHYSNGGTCLVNVFDNKAGFQYAKASGYGYDKFTKALSNCTIDGHELNDHCGMSLKPPKGFKLFPRDYKPRKGYQLANFTHISKETGRAIYRDEWLRRAENIPGTEDITEKARELESAWQASDDCESGYMSCFRKPGLSYLESIGYRVIQAI